MCWNEGKKRHVVEAILIIALIFLIGCTKEEPAQEWEAPQNQSVIINITDTNNIALNANLTIEQIKIIRHEKTPKVCISKPLELGENMQDYCGIELAIANNVRFMPSYPT